MSNKFVADADAFRFYEDDGSPSESASTPIDAQDTNVPRALTSDNQLHLRYRVQEVGDGDVDGETTDDYTLEFQENGGGGWAAITASSSIVQADTSSLLSDGSATTNRSAPDGITDGSGSFVAGEQEDGDGEITDSQLTGNDFTEHVWALDLISADWGSTDFIEFRMRYNGGGMTNSVTPRITKAVFTPDADKFRFYEDGTESGSSPIAAEDTDLTSRDVSSDSQFHLRWRVQETQGVSGNALDDYYCFASKNSGTFFQVGSATSDVKTDSGSGLVEGNDTTDRATNGISNGSGSFVVGEQDEVNWVLGNRLLTADDYTEHVLAGILISADLSESDTIDFQFRGPTNDSSDIINSITPRITVTKVAPSTALRDIIMGPGIIPFAR